jgi:FMN phosphatase YigB (HAD superfamily)
MKKILVSDVSLVLLFPKDKNYSGSLNQLYKENKDKPNFDFFDYFEINTQLLDIYNEYQKDFDFYIFTSDSIQDEPVLQPYWEGLFQSIFSASKMGTHKSKPESYQLLSDAINCKPMDITYIDDNQENISAAIETGLNAFQYKSNTQVKELLETFV